MIVRWERNGAGENPKRSVRPVRLTAKASNNRTVFASIRRLSKRSPPGAVEIEDGDRAEGSAVLLVKPAHLLTRGF